MAEVLRFAEGGYRFVKGVFQYSAGVAAEPGFVIERARFDRPVLLADGFAAIAAHLKQLGRPLTAFCACELRSPAPFDDAGFEAFNRGYIKPLEEWGIFRDGLNPIARSNVCPEIEKPAAPSFYAFSYTMPAGGDTRPSFVVAGSGESPEGNASYAEKGIRIGEQTPDALREKAQFVLAEMERRMAALGYGWRDTTASQVYTVFDLHPFLADEIVKRGAASAGLTWQFCRPPLDVLDYEMDVRGVRRELVL
ncbi:hypothetical protein [Ferrovibrio sp.]|uniref:2-amino-5-chloromuconate deaminase CnbZ n=1 Tax=Ferrovibrio sp. TaxID=1917215 RepID=UPI001B62F791|nr:hypothetical protein [Ferrovibrio sp.]MBP7065009.1 hypothetical protein [Ferrovibrio sp.]